jgi:hypothetical protein
VFTGNDFSFDEESDSPQLNQVASAVDSATGYHMILKAQSCTGATSTGGDLRLKGGAGTSANGATQLMDASNNVLLQAGPADNALDALVPLGMAANDADSAPTGAAGDIAYFTNGDGGSPCLAVHNGTNWLRIALGTAVASS